jgi:hypothetical protein
VCTLDSDKFEPWIAIRYLGGILDSPSFWIQRCHPTYHNVTKKLFERGRQLVEDVDVECWVTTNVALGEIHRDVQGIDLFTSALLNGVRIWYQQEQIRPLGPSLSNFARMMALIRR